MMNLEFPNNITYNQKCIPFDFVPDGYSIKTMKYACASSENNVIKIQTDTSSVTDMSYAFSDSKAYYIESFDTSSVTDMYYAFDHSSIYKAPELSTSSVTNMSYMFSYCKNLYYVPQYDMSNVTNITSMYSNCEKLTKIPYMNCSKATKLTSIVSGCYNLTEIGIIECGSVTDVLRMFGYSATTENYSRVTTLGGFRNLGSQSSLSGTNDISFIGVLANLTKESVLNVLNNLYDRASAGYSVLTLKMHANHLNMLSDEEKAIATNKGWTLA